jgi:UDP-N-acetylmuramoyl-tripeptide--D-alanyl-D-alanine ligase
MTLWTATDAAAATGGRTSGEWAASGVSIDTRTIAKGDLFVALADIRDGHDFVGMALDKGAAAALVTHRPEGVADDAPLLIVPNVLKALEDLGSAARARTGAKVIGITGSVGKTSTKEMLRTVLQAQGKIHAAEASYNNHWGVPLTLARMPQDTEFAIIEIGMNHAGEIAPLAKMAQLDAAMITTVAPAHLEAFGSVAEIAVEKAAITEGLNGPLIANRDIETWDVIRDVAAAAETQVTWFGAQADAFVLTDVRLADSATVIVAEFNGTPLLIKLSVAGRHFAMNALGAVAVCDAVGADIARAAMDMANWLPPAGRGTRETLRLDTQNADDTVDLYDDAFNANPTSMRASLEVLAATQPRDNVGRIVKGRRIAVLGDMLELGSAEMQMHADMATDPSLPAVTVVHCVGPRMRSLYDVLPEGQRGQWVEIAGELAGKAHSLIDAGDVILVKGSKGSKVSLIVDALRKLGHPRDV